MASIFTFLLFLSYTGLVVQALSMQITRETGKPEDELLLQKDTDECPRVGSSFIPGCGAYNALLLAGCWCSCEQPGGIYTFFETYNSCQEVATVRQVSGKVNIICLFNNYSTTVVRVGYLTIILRNRADGRVGENQAIFRKIEQNNCFIIQHIDNKAQVYSRKTGGDLICRKKFKLVTFSRADRLE